MITSSSAIRPYLSMKFGEKGIIPPSLTSSRYTKPQKKKSLSSGVMIPQSFMDPSIWAMIADYMALLQAKWIFKLMRINCTEMQFENAVSGMSSNDAILMKF